MKRSYTAIELDGRPDCSDIQDALLKLTGARTVSILFIFSRDDYWHFDLSQVPRVFINGKFVGGGTDVKALYDSGKLQQYFK